jgi:hypothetical protein
LSSVAFHSPTRQPMIIYKYHMSLSTDQDEHRLKAIGGLKAKGPPQSAKKPYRQ